MRSGEDGRRLGELPGMHNSSFQSFPFFELGEITPQKMTVRIIFFSFFFFFFFPGLSQPHLGRPPNMITSS